MYRILALFAVASRFVFLIVKSLPFSLSLCLLVRFCAWLFGLAVVCVREIGLDAGRRVEAS